ncbi:MAG: hypothetical protein LBU25_11420 [Treponema sp.]|jgi:hypothetical protein|nr:hypothetical protein [Treponema sp.]
MRKRHGVFFGFAVLMIAAIFTLAGCDTNDGGDDDDNIIKISTAEQFNEIRNNLGGHYVLEADISLASYSNFEPIGAFVPASEAPEDEENPNLELAFTGVFDGKGHKISNITISEPTKAGVGLFGCVAGDNGMVKNLVVENVTVTGGNMLVGGVIGYAASTNPIENITLQGANNTITGNTMVGGIVGGGFGDIKNCSAQAAVIVTGESMGTGGVLAGGMENSSIISCNAKGSITAESGAIFGIGGLAACGMNAAEITGCTVDVTITVTPEDSIMIGGLLGYAGRNAPDTPTIISGCTVKADITVPASAERIGGIVGSGFYVSMYASYYPEPGAFTIRSSSTSGSITGCTDLVGKIAGYIYDNSTVEASCTSTMTGPSNNVGGDKNSAALDTLK